MSLAPRQGTPSQRWNESWQAFHEFAAEKGFHHRKISPLWPEADGHVEGFMKNLGKVARTAHSQGKDWRREFYVFVANYRATPHPSTGKSPYELCMKRTVRTKLPTVPQVSPDAEVVQKDQEAKARMKAYADLKRQTASPPEHRRSYSGKAENSKQGKPSF